MESLIKNEYTLHNVLVFIRPFIKWPRTSVKCYSLKKKIPIFQFYVWKNIT